MEGKTRLEFPSGLQNITFNTVFVFKGTGRGRTWSPSILSTKEVNEGFDTELLQTLRLSQWEFNPLPSKIKSAVPSFTMFSKILVQVGECLQPLTSVLAKHSRFSSSSLVT